jgi:hypothetical protein
MISLAEPTDEEADRTGRERERVTSGPDTVCSVDRSARAPEACSDPLTMPSMIGRQTYASHAATPPGVTNEQAE